MAEPKNRKIETDKRNIFIVRNLLNGAIIFILAVFCYEVRGIDVCNGFWSPNIIQSLWKRQFHVMIFSIFGYHSFLVQFTKLKSHDIKIALEFWSKFFSKHETRTFQIFKIDQLTLMESQPLEAHELHKHEDGSSKSVPVRVPDWIVRNNFGILEKRFKIFELAVIKKTMFPIHEYDTSKDSTKIIILPMLILAGMIIIGVNEYWLVFNHKNRLTFLSRIWIGFHIQWLM